MATAATIPNPQQAMTGGGQVAGQQTNQQVMPGSVPPVAAGAAATTNPMAAPGTVPATASNSVMPGATAQNGVNWTTGSDSVVGDFQATYGQGTGTALSSALQGLGTSTSNAVAATEANTNLEANNQYKNIQATEAAQGITPNSSTAALAQGDFYSQVNSSLQQTTAQQEEAEQSELIGALTGEGAAHGSDTSWMDTLGNVLSGSQSAIGAASGGTELNGSGGSGGGGGMNTQEIAELAGALG